MRRILAVCAALMIALPSLAGEYDWSEIQYGQAYQLVISATSSDISSSTHVSNKLSIPLDVDAIGLAIRPGTATISYASTVLSGSILPASFCVNLGLFANPQTADWWISNATDEVPPGAYLPMSANTALYASSVVTDDAGSTLFDKYGHYEIQISTVQSLVLQAYLGTSATQTANEGLTFEIWFKRNRW